MARYARVLAHGLGFGEADQRLVHTAGLLHDIGKLALPDRALRPGALTAAEWEIVRRLPQEAADLVGRVEGYGRVAEVILHHHEQVDGEGYPAGLIGREIPLLSRVLAVCNVYDTLTASDSYRRPALLAADALAELERVAGHQLDAAVVARFVELARRAERGSFNRDEHDFENGLDFERRALGLVVVKAPLAS